MSKHDLKEAILNALANNAEAMTANDLVTALAGEAGAKSVNGCLKRLISEGIDGEPVSFQLTAPVAEEMPSDVEELTAGAPEFLAASETYLSDDLESAFRDLEAGLKELSEPKPEVHNAEVKDQVLERLSKLLNPRIGSVLTDIREDLQQIAA